ncbi:V-set and transmembrane domain-containing protein 4 isoform X1 [Denticeps clupeoides]|uniref:V-set and transmembrane domain-containing protein 4 isoform X1 n=2 Tax=Denticeps clupeoides TaxID=299321 RepID=UPI0010A582EF|nr:V-set and transmembrane domain-containing protein 4 isoform X1 [Denticeps clupeoides]
MNISSAAALFLTSILLTDVCMSINVTVTPWPVTAVTEGDNVTLSCQVTLHRLTGSLPVVRWMFLSENGGKEHLVAKVNMRKAKFYGNYTKSFATPKLRLNVVKQGKIYDLLILNASRQDRGLYTCRAQEFHKFKNRWKAATNSSASTQLRVHILPNSGSKDGLWSLFEDVYLCAVLICSVGLMCMCMFTVAVSCQYLQRKRQLKENYHLVKSLQNSSGETVTSLVSASPALPQKLRKYKTKKMSQQTDVPPEVPAKAPIAEKIRRPKLIKVPPQKVLLPRIAEESLTYAELELIKPLPDTKSSCSGTVYAQILFEDQQV